MLVILAQGILPGSIQKCLPAFRLVLPDHLLSAPAVARQGMAEKAGVLIQNAGAYNRIDQRNKAASMASRYGNSAGF